MRGQRYITARDSPPECFDFGVLIFLHRGSTYALVTHCPLACKNVCVSLYADKETSGGTLTISDVNLVRFERLRALLFIVNKATSQCRIVASRK